MRVTGALSCALHRAREIHRRHLVEILAAAERPEEEFHRRTPVTQILRQRLHAAHVGFSARGILDRAVRAHDGGEIILHFAFARVALADAQLLPRRRRIDLEAARREPRQRIDLRDMQPVRAAIIRNAEGGGVGETAPADSVVRLEQDVTPTRGRHFARRSDAGRARADDRDVDLARGRDGAKRGPRGNRRRARDEIATIERHGFRIISAPPHCPIKRGTAKDLSPARARHCLFVHRAREPKCNAGLLNCVSKARRG
jgi:hypothetical protein